MKVFLIDPEGLNKGLNIGVGMLAACLKKAGYKVGVIDMNNNSSDVRTRLAAVAKDDLIGISIKSFTISSAVQIAEMVGRKDLICGGPHMTIDGVNFLQENPSFSLGVWGEGEETLPGLIRAIKNGGIESVKGVIHRQGSRIISSPLAEFNPDLDSLPDPDYSDFDSVNGKIIDYPLITSRGCPYGCIYCCVGSVSGKKMRFRSIERVVAEIERAKRDFCSESFAILDDNFTFDVERAKEFCRLLMKDGVDMDWSCPNGLRADRIDDELAALMAESGCKHASIGIESFDEGVFKGINKGESLAEIKKAVSCLREHGIRTNGFFLIGLPGDSLQRSLHSLKEASITGLNSAHWNIFVPYPGTKAWEWVEKHGTLRRSWKSGGHFGPQVRPVFDTPGYSQTEMLRMYNRANIVSHNYSAFFNTCRPLVFSLAAIVRNILRYDLVHLCGHLVYVLRNLEGARRYLSGLTGSKTLSKPLGR